MKSNLYVRKYHLMGFYKCIYLHEHQDREHLQMFLERSLEPLLVNSLPSPRLITSPTSNSINYLHLALSFVETESHSKSLLTLSGRFFLWLVLFFFAPYYPMV